MIQAGMEYTVPQGLRWDLLSYKVYGTSDLYEMIMDANVLTFEERTYMYAPVGKTLLIPYYDQTEEEKQIEDNGKAPWN